MWSSEHRLLENYSHAWFSTWPRTTSVGLPKTLFHVLGGTERDVDGSSAYLTAAPVAVLSRDRRLLCWSRRYCQSCNYLYLRQRHPSSEQTSLCRVHIVNNPDGKMPAYTLEPQFWLKMLWTTLVTALDVQGTWKKSYGYATTKCSREKALLLDMLIWSGSVAQGLWLSA